MKEVRTSSWLNLGFLHPTEIYYIEELLSKELGLSSKATIVRNFYPALMLCRWVKGKHYVQNTGVYILSERHQFCL